jgi:serine dehydrogenase proteinase
VGQLSSHIDHVLTYQCGLVENFFGSPVMSYVGQIHPSVHESYISAIEAIVGARASRQYTNPDRLVIVLTTPGGVVESVEKMVEVTRHHFSEVYFVVPYSAMSAGTIFCMSGDKIYMDYTSSLGPIDPQVPNPDGVFVPALGYIDKVEELIEKSRNDSISSAELLMLQRLDLATLRRYEQARDLSVSLLKKWLVRYKFKDWVQHAKTNPGTLVTDAEKEGRAEEIARSLSDNQRWHSHGRMIGIDTLTAELQLKIEDYSSVGAIRTPLRDYSSLLLDYVDQQKVSFRIHYRMY